MMARATLKEAVWDFLDRHGETGPNELRGCVEEAFRSRGLVA